MIIYDPLFGLFAFMMAYWWLLILTSIAAGGAVALMAAIAPKAIKGEPKSLASLRASMAITAVAIVLAGVSVFVGVAELIGYIFGYSLAGSYLVMTAVIFTFFIILIQWLLSPLFINLVYRTHPPRTDEERRYQAMLEEVARRSHIRTPKLRIAETNMPNAFSYGSPLSGSYVAVTRGLLNLMPDDEVEAVLGHEVGHLRHRDVSWILALSVIPLAVYYLGQMLIWSGFFGGGGGEGRDRGSGANGGILLMLVGMLLVVVGVVFRFLVGNFNRLREYYADANSAVVTSPRKIQRALARLHIAVEGNNYFKHQVNSSGSSMFKALFIVAPFVEISGGFLYEPDEDAWPWRRRREPDLSRYRDYDVDQLIEKIKNEKTDPVAEMFATHPPIPKRLRFIDNIKYSVNPVEP
ncbi:M48 family metalloprotease [Acidilobus sp.]|uniref:M48 family metalloprotease n=1 Tax=Acidilobus sp. TaxID=1872109 RepID=UPI003CFDD774